jgi:hypothetical protein
MIAAMSDDKRRVTMPKELPPKSAVTIEQVDENSWLITRQRPNADIVVFALPTIKELPADPEWEAVEARMVKHNNRRLPRFEE